MDQINALSQIQRIRRSVIPAIFNQFFLPLPKYEGLSGEMSEVINTLLFAPAPEEIVKCAALIILPLYVMPNSTHCLIVLFALVLMELVLN